MISTQQESAQATQSLLHVSQEAVQTTEVAASRDSKWKAIVAMNLFCITGVSQSILFKQAAKEGLATVDFQLMRNYSVLALAVSQLLMRRLNPVKEFPSDKKWTYAYRVVAGQLSFFLFNYALPMIPLTYFMIIYSTAPFWTSTLACVFLHERMQKIEIAGIVICFGAMASISLT